MTETTYDILTSRLDRVRKEIQNAIETDDFSRLDFLSSQINQVEQDLAQLLWIELPELNEAQKLKALSDSTRIFFNPGIFEFDAMRLAFFKRQAKAFFDTQEEQQRYISYTEEQYLGATLSLKDLMQETKASFPKASYQERQKRIHSQFVEVMQ